ncbi:MAG: 30S ribosomal protein S12 methylthiotransferase RimO [Kiritimatiellia bacterium]
MKKCHDPAPSVSRASVLSPVPISIGLVSLGCSKNAVDLQVMAGHLLKAGCTLAPDPDKADVILVNTCAFIQSAREEATAEILRACELKRAGQCRAVVVSGCFAQRYGERFSEVFPEVDAVLGVDALDRIPGVVKGLFRRTRPADAQDLVLPPGMPCRVFDSPSPALRLTGPAFAYLKIAEGCAHRCAYCAIPAIRGRYRSRAMRAIVAEARQLLATGVKELNVIAQDPMLYGVDISAARPGKKRIGLVDLLKKLDRLPGEFWIRVLYSYPSEITDEYLDWLATSPHAVKYVDVPLQHTDPRILKAMARGESVKATLEAADRIRAAVPGVTLRTTVMTGFPGETPSAFAKLLMDVKQMKFDHLGAFAFSPEEGTVAAEMDGRPALKTAQKREQDVMAAQKKIWNAKARTFVGKVYPALVVEPGIARMQSQAPDVDGVTYLTSDAPVGSFVGVRIVKVRGFDFEADVEAVPPESRT